MVRHIVMWKVDSIPKDKGIETAEDLRQMLLRLGDSIPVVMDTEAGVQNEDPPLVVLNMIFDDWDDLEEYRVHPRHIAAVKVLRKHTTKLGAVDYELP